MEIVRHGYCYMASTWRPAPCIEEIFEITGRDMKSTFIGMAVVAGLFTIATQASAADGKAVYDATCAACHTTGAAGAPKLGDKAAWAPRLGDMAGMKAAAIKGKGVMPAKGGNSALSDADVNAAVDYMVAQSK